jgi:hypothetical protein
VCFDAATEGATGGLLSSPTRRCSKVKGRDTPKDTPIPQPLGGSYPYTFLMAEEDTVLEEAMDNLKEAGQRIRATQSLMRSQGMEEGEPIAVASYDR